MFRQRGKGCQTQQQNERRVEIFFIMRSSFLFFPPWSAHERSVSDFATCPMQRQRCLIRPTAEGGIKQLHIIIQAAPQQNRNTFCVNTV